MASNPKTNSSPRRSTVNRGQPVKIYGAAGLMGKREKQILAMAARQAYDHQMAAGRVEPGQSFDEWRHDQVMDVVGQAGLRECSHGDYRPLLSWFQQLAGKEAQALATQLRSGRASDNGDPRDTHETRSQIAHEIRTRLEAHIRLAERPWSEIEADHVVPIKTSAGLLALVRVNLAKLKARKDAIEAAGGPIRHGYLVTVARGKTRRPDLDLGRDIFAGLAERCTVKQLDQILWTLVNRINAREGITTASERNKSQRSTEAKRRRRKSEIDVPAVHDPFEDLRKARGDDDA